MKIIKKFVVLAALILITTISLTSCKGTGTYYFNGQADRYVEITGSEMIQGGKSYEIEWVGDNHFYFAGHLYYCDGSTMYDTNHPTLWYSSKIIDTTK